MSSSTVLGNITPDSASAMVNDNLPVILTATDSTVASSVQNRLLVQQARLSNQKRALASAVAKYGASSTQAAAAQATVTRTQSAISQITLVHQQLTTVAPQVSATGWALHGRVYDSNLNPLSGYTVCLVDGGSNYQSAYGFCYTDNTGYFLINYAGQVPAQTTTTGQSPTGASASPVAGSSTQATSTTQAATPPPALYLLIADAQANPVFHSTAAFQPVTGNATYQAITLPAGEPELGDPPAQVRAVAFPPVQKKAKT